MSITVQCHSQVDPKTWDEQAAALLRNARHYVQNGRRFNAEACVQEQADAWQG